MNNISILPTKFRLIIFNKLLRKFIFHSFFNFFVKKKKNKKYNKPIFNSGIILFFFLVNIRRKLRKYFYVSIKKQ